MRPEIATMRYLINIMEPGGERDMMAALLPLVEANRVRLRWAGMMAQDIQKTDPHAVFADADGFLRVRFDLLPRESWPRVIGIEVT